MDSMFETAKKFNNGFGAGVSDADNKLEWDVKKVSNFKDMFLQAENFNSNIGSWRFGVGGSGISFDSMFEKAYKFSQDLSDWNTENVNNMYQMFYNVSAINNQDFSKWNISKINATNDSYNCTFFANEGLPEDQFPKFTIPACKGSNYTIKYFIRV